MGRRFTHGDRRCCGFVMPVDVDQDQSTWELLRQNDA